MYIVSICTLFYSNNIIRCCKQTLNTILTLQEKLSTRHVTNPIRIQLVPYYFSQLPLNMLGLSADCDVVGALQGIIYNNNIYNRSMFTNY